MCQRSYYTRSRLMKSILRIFIHNGWIYKQYVTCFNWWPIRVYCKRNNTQTAGECNIALYYKFYFFFFKRDLHTIWTKKIHVNFYIFFYMYLIINLSIFNSWTNFDFFFSIFKHNTENIFHCYVDKAQTLFLFHEWHVKVSFKSAKLFMKTTN